MLGTRQETTCRKPRLVDTLGDRLGHDVHGFLQERIQTIPSFLRPPSRNGLPIAPKVGVRSTGLAPVPCDQPSPRAVGHESWMRFGLPSTFRSIERNAHRTARPIVSSSSRASQDSHTHNHNHTHKYDSRCWAATPISYQGRTGRRETSIDSFLRSSILELLSSKKDGTHPFSRLGFRPTSNNRIPFDIGILFQGKCARNNPILASMVEYGRVDLDSVDLPNLDSETTREDRTTYRGSMGGCIAMRHAGRPRYSPHQPLIDQDLAPSVSAL